MYGSDEQDEWLISPYVEVGENMELSYQLFLEPSWLFVIDSKHVNWNTYEFIGEPECAVTLQVWAQAEGEDWVLLHDYFEDYKGLTYRELNHLDPVELEKKQESLKDFYGKKTRVAFRYVGNDGNTMYIDAIGIGYPTIDNVTYVTQRDMQFWGPIRSAGVLALDQPIAIYPVNEPVIWSNMGFNPNINYFWTYTDPESGTRVSFNEDPEELSVTYAPDYSSEERIVNNFYEAPLLRAEAPNCVPAEYQASYLLQAGGKPVATLDGVTYEPAMLPFNLQELGLTTIAVDDPEIGDPAIPVFGHNVNTNQYWLNYSLNGEEEIPGDYSHLIAIANVLWPRFEAATVVHGVDVYGFGQMTPDAEFKATIYAIDYTLSTDYETLTPLATKTIKGSDVIRQDPTQKCYMCLPFDFDEPVVVRATEEYPAFFVMFEGFNSDKVDYFAPLQSELPDPNFYCNGYIVNHIDLSNQIGRPAYYSTKSMRYKEDGEIKTCTGAFAIALNAEFPWLTTDCTGIALPDDGSEIEVKLGSYYDASKLTVEAPEGVNATVSGQYDHCVLKANMTPDAAVIDDNIVVKGPGVEVTIPVTGNSGIGTIISNGEAVLNAVYDLAGRRIDSAATPGVYLMKYSDGTTRKVIIK